MSLTGLASTPQLKVILSIIRKGVYVNVDCSNAALIVPFVICIPGLVLAALLVKGAKRLKMQGPLGINVTVEPVLSDPKTTPHCKEDA